MLEALDAGPVHVGWARLHRRVGGSRGADHRGTRPKLEIALVQDPGGIEPQLALLALAHRLPAVE